MEDKKKIKIHNKLPPPDHPDANKLGCTCSRDKNKLGEGTVVVDEDGHKCTEYFINPTCPIHTPIKAWIRFCDPVKAI